MGKTIRATVHQGRFEPLEPVDFPEGADLVVTVEEAGAATQWFAELHRLFGPVRKEFAGISEATIDRRIARAVKAVRARKRAQA